MNDQILKMVRHIMDARIDHAVSPEAYTADERGLRAWGLMPQVFCPGGRHFTQKSCFILCILPIALFGKVWYYNHVKGREKPKCSMPSVGERGNFCSSFRYLSKKN